MNARRLTALIAEDVIARRELLNHMLDRLNVNVVAQVADGDMVDNCKLAQRLAANGSTR